MHPNVSRNGGDSHVPNYVTLGVLTLEQHVRRCVASCGMHRGGFARKLDQQVQDERATRSLTSCWHIAGSGATKIEDALENRTRV